MHTNKEYILPVILILLLLLLAGFFIFTQQEVESPVIKIEEPIIPDDIKIATSTLDSLTSTSTDEETIEETDTNSSSTSATSSDIQIENEQ